MLKALEVLVPVFVTMALGYGAARHGRFGAAEVPILNKVVLLYAVPMSISVGILRLSRSTLLDNVGLLLVLIVGLTGVFVIALAIVWSVAGRDLGIAALRALAIAFPAVPFVGPSLLTPLYGADGAILTAAVALVGNIVLVPNTIVCLSLAKGEKSTSGGPGASKPGGPELSLWTNLRQALAHGLSQPIVWASVLALVVVLAGVKVGSTIDNSLALLGAAGGGVALFTSGIVLQSQSISLSPAVIVNVVGKNVVTPLVLLGLAYLFGQGDKAGEIAVTASILAAPIIATLAVENGVAVREMSSTLLLSAITSVLTTGAFIALTT